MKRAQTTCAPQRPVSALSQRAERILAAVVREHIRSVRPISSAAIAKKCEIKLGAASIRSILSELEKDGYLRKDHSSSGRVPTDKSFRLYVDTLREMTEPKPSDIEMLTLRQQAPLSTASLTQKTTRALSSLTSCAALLLMPGIKSFTIKEIKLIAVNDSKVLVIIVSKGGLVHTSTVRVERAARGLNMEQASNYLCHIGQGLTLKRLRAKLIEEMKSEKNLFDAIAPVALRLGGIAVEELEKKVEEEFFLDGTALIFDQPEFKEDAARIKRVFAALEEKNLIVKILDASINELKDGANPFGRAAVSIHIGTEGENRDFDGLSFVTAPYGMGSGEPGTVGIVGPVRMDYPKIIPLVNYAARLLGRAL